MSTVFLFFLPLLAGAQGDPVLPVADFPVAGQLCGVDRLSQLYVVDTRGGLRKYDERGRELFFYTNRALGDEFRLDDRDPFSVLLYFPGYTTLLILDRTLNELAELNLAELGYLGVELVATSQDNQIWLYDPQDFRLKKIDRFGRLQRESQDLSLQLGNQLRVRAIHVAQDEVYLETDGQLLLFNVFGQFQKQIPRPAGELIRPGERFIWLRRGRQLLRHELFTGEEQLLFTGEGDFSGLYLVGRRCFVGRARRVAVYDLGE